MHIFKNLSLSVIFILLLSTSYSNQIYCTCNTQEFCTTFEPGKEIPNLNTTQNGANDVVHTTPSEHQHVVLNTVMSSPSYESPLSSPKAKPKATPEANKCPQTPKLEYNFNKREPESRFGFYEKLEIFNFCKQASSELPKAKNNLLGNSDKCRTRNRSKSCSFFNCNLRLIQKRSCIIEYLLFNEWLPKKSGTKYNTCIHGRPIAEHNYQHDTFSKLEQNL